MGSGGAEGAEGAEEMGRWGDGEMGRWGGHILHHFRCTTVVPRPNLRLFHYFRRVTPVVMKPNLLIPTTYHLPPTTYHLPPTT
ncbi:MAG: hypothetical protein F6J96_31640 [Symploca sp. SIO1C2]|nr:hypothetical protein [Symploca sp. SIO1C2]